MDEFKLRDFSRPLDDSSSLMTPFPEFLSDALGVSEDVVKDKGFF